MKERGWFLYLDSREEIQLAVEKGETGIPLKAILPEYAGEGAGFDDFPVRDYLSLAKLILVTPKDWNAFCQHRKEVADKDELAALEPELPGIDPHALGLINAAGNLDQDCFQDLAQILIVCWEQKPATAIEPCLVSGLIKHKVATADIIKILQLYVDQDGKFDWAKFKMAKETKLGPEFLKLTKSLTTLHNQSRSR